MIFEIYDRKTNEVVERHNADIKSFLVYWNSQCNKEDYGYRPVKERPAAKPPRAGNPKKSKPKKR